MSRYFKTLWLASAVFVAGCVGLPEKPLPTVDNLELERFMGDWYVIAAIPTFMERDAYNPVESYALNDDGSIATTFRFRNGGFDGEQKSYQYTGYVEDTESNAVWGVQIVWPFRADYRVMHIADDYSVTVVGRQRRDFAWIMARQPALDEEKYSKLVALIAAAGYDPDELQKMPQRWPAQE